MARFHSTSILVLFLALAAPESAWASDYSGLLPFVVLFVVLAGGFFAGFEWTLINAVAERKYGPDEEPDPETLNRSRFGCGLGTVLWVVNSIAVWVFLLNYNW